MTCYCGTPLLHAPTPRPGENEKGKCPVCYGREGEEAGKGPVATRSVATQTEEEEEDFAMMTGSGNLDYDVVNVSAGEESQSESLDAVADTPGVTDSAADWSQPTGHSIGFVTQQR